MAFSLCRALAPPRPPDRTKQLCPSKVAHERMIGWEFRTTEDRPIYCANLKPFIYSLQVSADCFSNFGRAEEVRIPVRNLSVRLHDGPRSLCVDANPCRV